MRCLIAALAIGCGSSPGHFTTISNGGVATQRGPCIQIAMSAREREVAIIRPGMTECTTEVDEIVVGAAGVYWRTGDAVFVGPTLANAALVQIPFTAPLAAADSTRALEAGTSARPLSSGEQGTRLASKQTTSALDSGSDAKRIAGGEDRRGLDSGESARRPEVIPPRPTSVRLRKTVDVGRMSLGGRARYTLELENPNDMDLSGVLVFDRVPAQFAVVGTEGTSLSLPDGSTLVTWSRARLAARGHERFEIRVELRTSSNGS